MTDSINTIPKTQSNFESGKTCRIDFVKLDQVSTGTALFDAFAQAHEIDCKFSELPDKPARNSAELFAKISETFLCKSQIFRSHSDFQKMQMSHILRDALEGLQPDFALYVGNCSVARVVTSIDELGQPYFANVMSKKDMAELQSSGRVDEMGYEIYPESFAGVGHANLLILRCASPNQSHIHVPVATDPGGLLS